MPPSASYRLHGENHSQVVVTGSFVHGAYVYPAVSEVREVGEKLGKADVHYNFVLPLYLILYAT